jgi:hypothetical protein
MLTGALQLMPLSTELEKTMLPPLRHETYALSELGSQRGTEPCPAEAAGKTHGPFQVRPRSSE